MIISTNNKLSFALESSLVKFTYENSDTVVGVTPLKDKVGIVASLTDYFGQYHLSIHLPFMIDGDETWAALGHFARLEDMFHLWIDPADGETKYCVALREGTAEELDLKLTNALEALEAHWDSLKTYDALSRNSATKHDDDGDEDDPLERLSAFLGM